MQPLAASLLYFNVRKVTTSLQDEEGELYVKSPAYLYELMNKLWTIRNAWTSLSLVLQFKTSKNLQYHVNYTKMRYANLYNRNYIIIYAPGLEKWRYDKESFPDIRLQWTWILLRQSRRNKTLDLTFGKWQPCRLRWHIQKSIYNELYINTFAIKR